MSPPPPVPTLRALSSSVLAGAPFGPASGRFLAELAPHCSRDGDWWSVPDAAWSEAPLPVPDPVAAAWMAGIAEHLAQASCARPPVWCGAEGFLPAPAFTCEPGTEATARVTTPSALARRNLFCGPVTAGLFAAAGKAAA